ncbi:hypothetical protein [Desulfatibacillum aliphaticivorans]|nr:hypothetical protein [Desulfatibacillum aliphaticivorans]
MKNVIFLDHRTKQQINEMPDQWPEEDLAVGHRIHKHTFLKGWRCLKITRVDYEADLIRVFVKKTL